MKNYKTLKNEQIYKILSKETFLVREEGSGTRILLERFDTIGKGRQYNKKEFSSMKLLNRVFSRVRNCNDFGITALNELNEGKIEAINLANLPIIRQWFL